MKNAEIRKEVRNGYGKIAKVGGSCCGNACGCGTDAPKKISKAVGYSDEEMNSVPEGANLGLGCGNPTALASLKKGETVLDLGSGAGFDCFLAANKVGQAGKVIGVDMTAEMIEKARANAEKDNYKNVEFRLGEIENLPVADNSIDVVISNCVINLSPDKQRVFNEVMRVLKPGGRFMISDTTLSKPLPGKLRNSIGAYVGCLGGAVTKEEYLGIIAKAGFKEVKIEKETAFPLDSFESEPFAKTILKELDVPLDEVKEYTNSVISIKVKGIKN